jgi:hypothetical protein
VRHDFDDLVGGDGLDPADAAALHRVHELLVEAGPPPGYTPVAGPTGPRAAGLRARLAGGMTLGFAALSLLAGGAYYLVAALDAGRGEGSARAAALPQQGVLVHGESLAGVQLGDDEEHVRALWGHSFTVCPRSLCDEKTWFYLYPTGDPFGAGVRFRDGRVTAVFTLGAPKGWRDDEGLRVGEVLQHHEATAGDATWQSCVGYSAKSTHNGEAVSSVLLQGLGVYGFALTLPSEPVCQ